ncbi:MAG: hypothetical protein F6J98_10705 [Moorea sp. SIO4G2]|nr:hypothetical protein [Moorena sp. SIO4G2]
MKNVIPSEKPQLGTYYKAWHLVGVFCLKTGVGNRESGIGSHWKLTESGRENLDNGQDAHSTNIDHGQDAHSTKLLKSSSIYTTQKFSLSPHLPISPSPHSPSPHSRFPTADSRFPYCYLL